MATYSSDGEQVEQGSTTLAANESEPLEIEHRQRARKRREWRRGTGRASVTSVLCRCPTPAGRDGVRSEGDSTVCGGEQQAGGCGDNSNCDGDSEINDEQEADAGATIAYRGCTPLGGVECEDANRNELNSN